MASIYQKIAIKIGTNVITKENGQLDKQVLKKLVEQISHIQKKGIEVVVISSGAVGAGRGVVPETKIQNDVTKRQVFSAVGQIVLMENYRKLFLEKNLTCAQILATKDDFRSREHYLNIKNCLNSLIDQKIIPIVNENDAVSVTELMFTDNDELAGLIASMLNADALVILTDVEGVFDGDPGDKNSQVIHEIDFSNFDLNHCVVPTRGKFSRGGMLTKCHIAGKLSGLGVNIHIANGKRENILNDILAGKKAGSKFNSQKKLSAVKKWLANSRGQEKGAVYIDKRAREALTQAGRIASLLPVGITKIAGEFKKGDIIIIKDEKGRQIGLGMAQYSSKAAKNYLGEKSKKALIHYDYLYLE